MANSVQRQVGDEQLTLACGCDRPDPNRVACGDMFKPWPVCSACDRCREHCTCGQPQVQWQRYNIGDRVMIRDLELPGVIISVWHNRQGVLYETAWFANGRRETAYLTACEIAGLTK